MADVSELEAQVRAATAAARDSAATLVKAIDRIMLMEPLVDAARELCLANEHAKLGVFGAADGAARAMDKLGQLVDAYNALAERKAAV